MQAPLFPRQQRSSSGFTLMEVLVSIAIFALIAVIVAPATNRVLKSAKQAADANNLRQIGLACTRLTQEHRNRVIVGIDQKNAFLQGVNTPWFTLLRPYLGHELRSNEEVPVLISPGDPSRGDSVSTYSLSARGFKRRSYAVNGRTFNPSNFPISRLSVQEPSRFLLIGNVELKGSDASGINGNSLASLALMPREWYLNGTANYLFLDGHVEAIQVDELMPNGDKFHLLDRSIPLE